MELIVKYFTENDCYKAGRTIIPQGIMMHSTATPNVMTSQWYTAWNKSGITACVHAFLDDKVVMQSLPWNHRGWHGGGSCNNTHISFEICEPSDLNNKEYFDKVYNNAIELCVMLCKEFNLTEKDIICHSEGYKLGIATNHGDVMHWFPKHNKNMDIFREDVRKALSPKKYYIITNYLPKGQYGIELNGFFDKYFDGLGIERWYAQSNQTGMWIETQYMCKENAEVLADRLNADGLLWKLVEE